MELKPQDVVLAAYLAVNHNGQPVTFEEMSRLLDMSKSQLHASTERALLCKLLASGPVVPREGEPQRPRSREVTRPVRPNILEFLEHGVRFVYPGVLGGITRGIPTAQGAPVLQRKLLTKAMPPVWPRAQGQHRGESLEPLYRNVPLLSLQRPELHSVFALIDLLRIGGARERQVAIAELKALFGHHGD